MNKLIGLVLCGGESRRMGSDKSLLDYHGMPQYSFVHSLLQPFCDEVFISINSNQRKQTYNHRILTDDAAYSGNGPMGALLTAGDKFTDASFLVAGCDYPSLTLHEIQLLVDARENEKQAVCFVNGSQIDEPLIAIYESGSIQSMRENFLAGNYSLRHLLSAIQTKRLQPTTSIFPESIDSEEEFKRVKKVMGKSYLPITFL